MHSNTEAVADAIASPVITVMIVSDAVKYAELLAIGLDHSSDRR